MPEVPRCDKPLFGLTPLPDCALTRRSASHLPVQAIFYVSYYSIDNFTVCYIIV